LANLETGICVIGAGVAGSIVARECIDAGWDVIMLEAGGRAKGRAMLLRLMEQVIRDYRIPRMRLYHYKARYKKRDYKSVGSQYYSLGGLALVVRGGSTLGWGGDAYRMHPEDFRLGSLTGHGLDWPISYEELEPYYALAEKTLRVAGDHSDYGHPPRSTSFPVPARPFDARDKLFLDLLSGQGWAAMHHNISLASDGGAFTADELLDELEKRPRFKLLTHCVSTRILCSKARANAVEGLDLLSREPLMISAEKIVVCASGIETPNLLRQSANQWWPNGLGNHSGHLGRHLISHTGIALGGRPYGFRFTSWPIGPTASTRHFDTGCEQASGKYILLWRPAPTGLLFLNATLEQFPDGSNSVSLGSAKTRFGTRAVVINFNYDERHTKRVRFIWDHLEILAKKIGLRVNFRRHYVNAHPMSTSRMSRHESDGVIDPNLRIHTMNNVYVCGSGSFPTSGAANPTMTIAALAHRLGAHLSNTSQG
jgi:choline dehydrogenase-like flavoprotein